MSKYDPNARLAVRRCVGANAGGGCGRRFVVRRWQVQQYREVNQEPDLTDRQVADRFVYCPTCVGGKKWAPGEDTQV